jgi:mono/diheme cytochrome c family protein
MNVTNGLRNRIAILVGAAALLALGSLPLIGQAQDATPAGEQQLIQQGEQIYTNVCIACHQPEGAGIEGIYPPLAGNPLLTTEDPTYFVSTVLTGRGGMPSFQALYSDEEIAAITTYIRQAWGNNAGPVSPEQVTAVRESIYGTPAPVATPEGQRPEGQAATPEATP